MLLAEDSSERRLQLLVQEGLLHQALAVIEGAAHGEGPDVAAPAGELPLLGGRDQPLGEQHRHFDAGTLVERRRHRAAGVAGGRHQDRERTLGTGAQPGETGRQETRTKILEGRGRPVKELQHRQPRLEWHERCREAEGLPGERGQLCRERIAGEEGRQQRAATPGRSSLAASNSGAVSCGQVRGTYRPPSGASPCSSAPLKPMAGDCPRELT